MTNNFIERKDYNNVITVKIVVPTTCNARCSFCYNKDKNMSCDKAEFLENFISSLNDIINRISGRNPISVDITGGEPTFDVSLFKEILRRLKESGIKEKTCRMTMTTNGFHLSDVVDDCKGIIDYINISVHDYNDDRRKNILGQSAFVYKEAYTEIVKNLSKIGIPCSAVSVVHKPINSFNSWRDEFIKWCKEVGFISLRLRCDCNSTGDYFDTYMLDSKEDTQFKVITYENTPDSHWLRLRRYDGFRVFFLHGVLDTSLYTKGIEYIIDNDGRCYCDYYKRTPIDKYEYEVGKIFDKVIS